MGRRLRVCAVIVQSSDVLFFFFNDTATTEIYTLSLHDALPISVAALVVCGSASGTPTVVARVSPTAGPALAGDLIVWGASKDRKSTRLNSSHANISYAVFCLKKKKMRLEYITCPTLNRILLLLP